MQPLVEGAVGGGAGGQQGGITHGAPRQSRGNPPKIKRASLGPKPNKVLIPIYTETFADSQRTTQASDPGATTRRGYWLGILQWQC